MSGLPRLTVLWTIIEDTTQSAWQLSRQGILPLSLLCRRRGAGWISRCVASNSHFPGLSRVLDTPLLEFHLLTYCLQPNAYQNCILQSSKLHITVILRCLADVGQMCFLDGAFMLGSKTTCLHIAHSHVHNPLAGASLLSVRTQNTPAVASRQSQAYFHHLALLYFTTMSIP